MGRPQALLAEGRHKVALEIQESQPGFDQLVVYGRGGQI